MRYLLSFLLIAGIFAGCGNNDSNSSIAGKAAGASVQKDTANFTTIQWIDSVKDFGKIEEGQKLEVSFRFKNTGDKPLIIERVQPSCGCTVAEQSKDPIAPGAEGQIKASFNSEGRAGINHKTLFVYANTKGSPSHSVQFQVEVEKKKQ
jgi:hypothetical protein